MRKRIIPTIIAVLALGAGLYGGFYWQTHYMSGISMTRVPVPKYDIPPYTLLVPDMFTFQEVPRALTVGGAYQLSESDLEGSISVETLLSGLPVARRMAVPADQYRLAAPNLEVVSLPAEAVRAVGGEIHVGETINLYSLQPAPKQDEQINASQPKPEVIFVARVPVVDVLAGDGRPVSAGDQNAQPQPLKILVVAAPPDTVQAILEAIATEKHEGAILWITLATP